MSRRERREAERSGQVVSQPDVAPAANQSSSHTGESSVTTSGAQAASSFPTESGDSVLLSRRELRERERRGLPSVIPDVVATEPPAQSQSETAMSTPQPDIVLPEVSLSSQVNVIEAPTFVDPAYSSEPSTNSIVLDRIPDAVGVPIEVTGEIITTGSIAILTEPVDTVLTGPLDDRALDSISANDAVTGAITIVEPVSALQVIKNRPHQSVLPERSLKSGWWKPILFALATIGMVAAAVVAAFVIIETLGL